MSSTQISVAQAKAEFAALVVRAEAGEDMLLTRDTKIIGYGAAGALCANTAVMAQD